MFLTCRTVQKGGLLGFVIMTSRGFGHHDIIKILEPYCGIFTPKDPPTLALAKHKNFLPITYALIFLAVYLLYLIHTFFE